MDNSLYLEIGELKILVDPWLEGAEIDYFSWFNKQWHRTPPISYSEVPNFDAVLITQKYPDHFHIETLKKLAPKHIIAPKSLAKKIKKKLPNTNLTLLDSKNNKATVKKITITFLPTQRKIDPIYDAYIIDDGTESIFLATHGFKMNDNHEAEVKKAPQCKLLISPFNYYKLPVFLGGIVSPGLDGVKQLCEVLKPTKVVAVHDEDKHAKGLVTKFAKVIRPKSVNELLKSPWLGNRFEEMNHYKKIQIS